MNEPSIAMIVAQFPNIVQTYIVSMISGIRNNGCRVTVIASRAPARHITGLIEPPASGRPDRTLYINTGFPRLLAQYLLLPVTSAGYRRAVGALFRSEVRAKYGLKYFLKAIVRCRAVANGTFDILHSHNLTLSYDYLFFRDIFHCRLVTTFHGLEPRGSSTLAAGKQQLLFREGDIFLVNTEFARKSLQNAGCPEDRIRIIPQGTVLDSFPYRRRSIPDHGNINLLTVGRLSVEKGQHVAIRAIGTLAERFPNIRYHLVGDGPERNTLRELVNDLGLQEKVVMHGYASNRELADIYADAHIFILPSIDLHDGLHVETQGVVLQEAQANGLVVVASNTGGIPEVIRHGDTGILYEPDNPGNLAAALGEIITTPALYDRLAVNGRKDIERNYDADIIASRLKAVYTEILQAR